MGGGVGGSNPRVSIPRSESEGSQHPTNPPGDSHYSSHHNDDYYQRPPRTQRPRPRESSNKEPNITLPSFHDKDNVETYLDWEMKVEQLFSCHGISEEKKVSLAILSFQGHAMYWWTSLEKEHHEPPIQYWNELRSPLRRRHIPPYYDRELMHRLQRLKQGSSSVEEYRQQMELLMMRVGIREEERTTIYRFQRKSSFKAPSKDAKRSDIECFKCLGCGHIASQCPTKKTMILRGQDHYSSHDEATSSSSSDEKEVLESEEETYPCEGYLLMVRRLLGNQSSNLDQSQRENLFHTRCKVLENTCSLIVDSGSSCNCCSTRLVNKLALTTLPHPKPYKLQWINEEGGNVVNQQVNVPISIGKYKDEILCDIVPLDASVILLGRPWQFDKKTIHEGHSNKISFHRLGRKWCCVLYHLPM
uniref:CCHC-type domain-containing protein n=1 Tax=Cajanus cajan TaxID=3821 RepID=A0A151UIQ7_CAJCA